MMLCMCNVVAKKKKDICIPSEYWKRDSSTSPPANAPAVSAIIVGREAGEGAIFCACGR